APLAAPAPPPERIAAHARQIVLLTSPHRTLQPFFQQPNALRVIHAGIEQLIEALGGAGRSGGLDRLRSIAATGGLRSSETATLCVGVTPTPRPRRSTRATS